MYSYITYGVWLHVAVTWDEEIRLGKIFTNGHESARRSAFAGLSNYEVMNNQHRFYQIGNKKDSGETFHGLIRELKVFKKVLNTSEILMEASGAHIKGMLNCTIIAVKMGQTRTPHPWVGWNRP